MEAISLDKDKFYATKEEYLHFEDLANYKSEYVNGEVIAMSGGTISHNSIGVNIISALHSRLRKGNCRVFNSDTKLDVEKDNSYYYPDAMVICGEIQLVENRNDIVKNPVLIVEVLSPGTDAIDKGPKFDAYLTIPSLKEYVIINQDKPLIFCYFKLSENEWKLTIYNNLLTTLKFQSVGLEIPVNEIYENVFNENA